VGAVIGCHEKEMAEVASGEVKAKTFKGVGALVLRNLLMQPISFLGFVFLSVFLKRWELGVFWAVSEIIGFLGYFSDIGLAAALIQKRDQPEKEEIRATFTIQQLLVVFLILAAVIFTPFLQQRFGFDNQGKRLFYALLFSFFAASLKTIPSVMLERKLQFEKLAIVDLVEQAVFTGLAVLLAWRGFGTNSWIGAVLARSIIGVILIYLFSPWPIGISFHFEAIRNLVRFGLPFQANSLLAVAKDRLVNIFLWGLLGSDGVGILGWAQRWAQIPLRFLMDSVIRVTFPAYSRLQDNKQRLGQALEKSCFFINLFIFPVLAGMGLVMPKVVNIFPQYHKWAIAIVPFWWFLANFAFGAATTPLVNAFNSVGKVKISFNLMVFWTILTWLLVPPLARLRGTTGAAMGLFLVSASSFIAWWLAKREFKFSLTKAIFLPLMLTLIMVAALLIIDPYLPETVVGLAIFISLGALVYGLMLALFQKEELIWLVNGIFGLVRKS